MKIARAGDLVEHPADQFRLAVIDESVDVAAHDFAHPRLDFVHPFRREGVAEDLAMRLVGVRLLIDQGRFDPDILRIPYPRRFRAKRPHRMPCDDR